MSVTDEVKQRTDIIEVISQYTSLTKSGRTFKALCPFHSEKHPSFFVYPEQQSWHCFGACNTGGDVFSFIMKKENLAFGEALRLLAEKAGVTISSKPESDAGAKERERLYQINQDAAQYFYNLLLNSPAAKKARDYLTGRGLLPKTASDFQLGFSLNQWEALKQYLVERGYTESELITAGLIIKSETGETHDRFRNKLMFPIQDIRGHIAGFGARVLDDSLPKYINSPLTPIFDKSASLYGVNLASTAIRQENQAVIVEGYMDVLTAHQNGFNNVVASMGTSVTEKQVSILKKLTKNMALALDADVAGEEAMLRCVEYENILGAEVKVILLPSGKDPDDVIKEDTQSWQDLVDKALPVIDYSFNMATSKLDMTTAKDKSQVTNQLLPILARMKNDIRLNHYLTRLSELTGISYNKLEAVLKDLIAKPKAKRPAEKREALTLQSVLSNPIEEYCLALLLQYPELKDSDQELAPEYFENRANQEIFIAWQKTGDISSLRDELDIAIHEHLDYILNYLKEKNLPATQIERKYADCVLRLREEFLRKLEAKREEVLASKDKRGTAADVVKLNEQGIEPRVQLGKVLSSKNLRGQNQRR